MNSSDALMFKQFDLKSFNITPTPNLRIHKGK